MLDLFAALAVGYLLGGIPTAALVAKLRGERIFEVGSGNMGAMNVARQFGWPLGVAVALVDVGKGALATYLGIVMAAAVGRSDLAALVPALAAGLGAVLGHAYSPWVQFEGGKAIATTFGITLPLFPQLGLYYLALIVALYLLVRRVTLAGFIGALALPVMALSLLPQNGWQGDELFMSVTALLLVGLVGAAKHVQAWLRERRQRRFGDGEEGMSEEGVGEGDEAAV